MEYKYCNQFNLSNELSQAISAIISKKENDNYVCKTLALNISEETYSFFVVMKYEFYKRILKLSFKSRDEINMALQLLSIFSQEYDGIFDSRTLSEEFPYLQDFFTSIDDWRVQTGRVTIDDNILNESAKRTLCKTKSITK